MIVLSRFLDLNELGFASLLAATYAGLEQITDLALYRFVLSAPRDHYDEALASAHSLSALRGLVVGCIAVAISPLVAGALSLGSQWSSFAAVGLVVIVRSLEHLAPRVAERDYRYGPQLKVAIVAQGLSMVALLASASIWPSHVALLVSLLAQQVGLALASRAFSGSAYRFRFHSPYFAKAFHFGYPLMFSGIGLAISAQADRFLVGGMLGLPQLGVYSVLTLATVVPSGVVSKIINTVTVPMLFNSAGDNRLYQARLRLASRQIPLVAALFAIGILTLMNIVVPLVFGQKFIASRWMVVLLAFVIFIRMVRGDPGTAVLLIEGRTKRMALVSFTVVVGLVFVAALVALARTLEAVALGRCLSELGGLAAMLYFARTQLRGVIGDTLKSIGVAGTIVVVGGVVMLGTPVGTKIAPSLMFLGLCAAVLALLAARDKSLFAQAGFLNRLLTGRSVENAAGNDTKPPPRKTVGADSPPLS